MIHSAAFGGAAAMAAAMTATASGSVAFDFFAG